MDGFKMADKVVKIEEIMHLMRPMPSDRKRAFVTLSDDGEGQSRAGQVSDSAFIARLSRLSIEQLSEIELAAKSLETRPSPGRVSLLTEAARTDYLRRVKDLREDIAEDENFSEDGRTHFLKLLGQLEDTLKETSLRGSEAVELAAKAVVADSVLNKSKWEKASERRWFKAMGTTVSALLLTLSAAGGYSGAKELVHDLSQLPALSPAFHALQPASGDAPSKPEDESNNVNRPG